MIRNVSLARSKGFKLVDVNTFERPDCKIEYIARNKNAFRVTEKKFDKRGNVIAETVKHFATFYAAFRGVL